MSQPKRDLQLSEAEIRAIYAEGEGAVVSLVTEVLERLNRLEAEVKELKGRLSKDSRNSSKPRSGDGFSKRTRSLRRNSDQPSGGQTGHPGQTLEWSHDPDRIERHSVSDCSGCGASLATVPVEEVLARQVLDIPPIDLVVTEHQVEVKGCPHCVLNESAMKVIFLAINNISKKWTMPIRDWKSASNRFAIEFEGRFPM